MNDARLTRGIEALKSGDRRAARRLFGQLVNDDPDNLAAWWYLAAALEDPEQQKQCLRQVLRLRPDHQEAKDMLLKLERRLSLATPSKGFKRPTLDAEDLGQGRAVVRRQARPEPVPEIPGTEPTPAKRSTGDVTIMAVVSLVALAAIIGTGILVWSGRAAGWLGVQGPDASPTLRALAFDVPACAVTGDEQTTLVFINNTGVSIEIYRGPQDEEEYVMSLLPDEQGRVETRPGVLVRYAARTGEEGFTTGGAIIEVPQGNSCRVPVY